MAKKIEKDLKDEKREKIRRKYGYSNLFVDPVDVNDHIAIMVDGLHGSDKSAGMTLTMGVVNFYTGVIADLILEYEDDIKDLKEKLNESK